MKKIEKRFFTIYQYKEEEDWINEMAAHGWNLVKNGINRYEFESGKAGEYIYRIELLDKNAGSKESQQYINFLEETGIKKIGECNNWIYLRKNASEGSFEPNNPTMYELTHRLRVQKAFSEIRNVLMVILAIGSLIALVMNIIEYSSPFYDFCMGFFEGVTFAISIFLAISIPMFRTFSKNVESAVRELSLHE